MFGTHKTPQTEPISEFMSFHFYTVGFDSVLSCIVCLLTLRICCSHYGPKPHAIMWCVSTNSQAVNERLAGNAVVNMSRVIIRWFHLLRSKAANSKAIPNLEGKSHPVKKKSKDLNKFFQDFPEDLINALVLCSQKHSLFFLH